MMDKIESTRFHDLQDEWRDRKIRSIEYHPAPTKRIADYVYYDPWRRENIYRQNVWSRSNASCVITDHTTPGWIHDEAYIQSTPRDKSLHKDSYTYGSSALSFTPVTNYGRAPGPSSSKAVMNNTIIEIIPGVPAIICN